MLAGVLGLVYSEGLHFTDVLHFLHDNGYVPCWIRMYLDSRRENWNESTFMNKIKEAVSDVYDKHTGEQIISRLKRFIHSFNNPTLAPWRNGKRSSFKNCGLRA